MQEDSDEICIWRIEESGEKTLIFRQDAHDFFEMPTRADIGRWIDDGGQHNGWW